MLETGCQSLGSRARGVGAALVAAVAVAGFVAPATADETAAPLGGDPAAAPGRGSNPHLVARSEPPGSLRRYVEPARADSGPGLLRPFAREGWRLVTQIAPIFPTSDLGDTRDLMAASTGFSPRIGVGYEYMFGDLGITPGLAVQFARFGMEYQDGSVLYVGLQPNVQAALHLGRFAPYASLGVGVDHFHLAGGIANLLGELGGNTSTTGVGVDLQFGANVFVTPSVSLGLAWQIHPGFTTFKLEDTDRTGGSMAFMSVLFGVSYAL